MKIFNNMVRLIVGLTTAALTVLLAGCGSSATVGTITSKEFIPAHIEHSTEIIDGTHIPRSQKLPDCYKISIIEDNNRTYGFRCVPKKVFDSVSVGDEFDFTTL